MSVLRLVTLLQLVQASVTVNRIVLVRQLVIHDQVLVKALAAVPQQVLV